MVFVSTQVESESDSQYVQSNSNRALCSMPTELKCCCISSGFLQTLGEIHL